MTIKDREAILIVFTSFFVFFGQIINKIIIRINSIKNYINTHYVAAKQ